MKTKDNIIQDLLKENRKLKLLLDRDFLTGLFCYKKLKEDLKRYYDLHNRYNINFDIVMLDIDNFKYYNDKYGHSAGDKLLKRVAKIIKENIRKTDRAYRLSGGADEFVIIYSHHTVGFELFLNRINNALDKINIKVSYGYSNICEDVLNIIDKRMYNNKRSKK